MSAADDLTPSFGFQVVGPAAGDPPPAPDHRPDRFGHRQRVVLPADPARVWQALTDPEELGSWWGEGSTLDARPDGEGRFAEPGRPARRAWVAEVRPARRLVLDWWPEDPEVDEPASRRHRGDRPPSRRQRGDRDRAGPARPGLPRRGGRAPGGLRRPPVRPHCSPERSPRCDAPVVARRRARGTRRPHPAPRCCGPSPSDGPAHRHRAGRTARHQPPGRQQAPRRARPTPGCCAPTGWAGSPATAWSPRGWPRPPPGWRGWARPGRDGWRASRPPRRRGPAPRLDASGERSQALPGRCSIRDGPGQRAPDGFSRRSGRWPPVGRWPDASRPRPRRRRPS